MSSPEVTFVSADLLVAILDRGEPGHGLLRDLWRLEFDADSALVTTNYSVAKAALELHRRYGIIGPRDLLEAVLPAMHVEWCTRADHATAVAALLAASDLRRDFVDHVDEQIRRRLGITQSLGCG